jgi:EAL domain-containing protein (putative c-di-GMP-specific phosphodiesterase class I)
MLNALAAKAFDGKVLLLGPRDSRVVEAVCEMGAELGVAMGLRASVAAFLSAEPPPSPAVDAAEAMREGWLELWYQPKIDLRTGALAGAEGLVRYCHPIHGTHPIDSLLPQTGAETRAALIQHFLIRALRDWDELDRAGIHVRTAVNANVDVLTNMDLTTLVRQNRPRSKAWPGLILEVSEHEVIRDLNLAHEIATQLRIYDITLAISNFGAGSSSFERLRELPFSELKLHPGFVAGCADDERNAGICRASIELAHRFEVVTVADGVDSASDLQALQSMDCDVGQGPYLAEPMPRSQFIAALRERARTNQEWLA